MSLFFFLLCSSYFEFSDLGNLTKNLGELSQALTQPKNPSAPDQEIADAMAHLNTFLQEKGRENQPLLLSLDSSSCLPQTGTSQLPQLAALRNSGSFLNFFGSKHVHFVNLSLRSISQSKPFYLTRKSATCPSTVNQSLCHCPNVTFEAFGTHVYLTFDRSEDVLLQPICIPESFLKGLIYSRPAVNPR
jgi:hypothetical protein